MHQSHMTNVRSGDTAGLGWIAGAALALLAGSAAEALPVKGHVQPPAAVRLNEAAVRRLGAAYQLKKFGVLTQTGVRDINLAGDISKVDVEPQSLLAARLPERAHPRPVGPNVEFVLPYRFGVAEAPAPTLDLRPILIVEGGAVEYRPEHGIYEGSMLLGLRDERYPNASGPLPRDVGLQLIASSGTITPDRPRLRNKGQPFVRVRTAAPDVQGDALHLTVIPDFSAGEDVPVPVRRPTIALDASPATIQGFGLESCRVTASAPPAYARSLGKVTLSTSRGRLDPAGVELDAAGVGATSLYSSGTGVAAVRVLNVHVNAREQTVGFVFPWRFLCSSLVGGAIGGIFRRYRGGRRKRVRDAITRGMLFGLLAAIAIAFGVNLIALAGASIYAARGFSEGLVFLVAAVAAGLGGKKADGAGQTPVDR
jgi:hypothetical protein